MICPHCRHETLKAVCSACGWDRLKALRWAAEEAESRSRLDMAAAHWEELRSFFPADPEILVRRASCVARWALQSGGVPILPRADQCLEEALSKRPDWEDGRQLQILLCERNGRLSELESKYRSQGVDRWADVIRLVERFKAEKTGSGNADSGIWRRLSYPVFLHLAGWVFLVVGWRREWESLVRESEAPLSWDAMVFLFLGLFCIIVSIQAIRRTRAAKKPVSEKDSLP